MSQFARQVLAVIAPPDAAVSALMFYVAVWTIAIAFIVFALLVVGPDLVRALREAFFELFPPGDAGDHAVRRQP